MIDSEETFECLYEYWINELREIKKEMEGAKEMADKRPVLDLKDLINLSSDIDFLYRISLMKAKEDDDLGLEDFVEQIMIKFSKVPYSEFRKSAKKCGFEEDDIEKAYKNIKLPTRATKNSAGYDFYFPFDINVDSYKDKYIPTGIRCEMDDNVFLMLVPKSGLGCKYGMSMQNTVGIIDADYFNAENYGHIHAMINTKHQLCLVHGQKFMQGIFVNYLKTDDDTATGGRKGGFGSTGDFDKL